MTNLSIEELLEKNRQLVVDINHLTKQETALKGAREKKYPTAVKTEEKSLKSFEEEITSPREKGFELEVEKYMIMIDKLSNSDSLSEDISLILPNDKDYDLSKLLKRMVCEFQRKIELTNKFILDERKNGTDDKELDLFLEEITLYEEKINAIGDLLYKQDVEKKPKEENKLIFLLNNNDRVKVFEDISMIDCFYYQGLIRLFDSIKSGYLKGYKTFTENDKFYGLSEVRDLGSKTRVFIDNIAPGYFVVLGAIVKKCNTSSSYQNNLKSMYNLYKSREQEIRNSLSEQAFLETNELLENELYTKLGKEAAPKQKKKV